jgi:hypothetical protein
VQAHPHPHPHPHRDCTHRLYETDHLADRRASRDCVCVWYLTLAFVGSSAGCVRDYTHGCTCIHARTEHTSTRARNHVYTPRASPTHTPRIIMGPVPRFRLQGSTPNRNARRE